jgi:beta-phosphoglucomutase-like phosphatase (HAD superfamily)
MKHSIELAVFDIAGTTVKDNGEIAMAFDSALSEFGYDIDPQQINILMGYKKTEAIRIILENEEGNTDKISAKLVDKIHQRFFTNHGALLQHNQQPHRLA